MTATRCSRDTKPYLKSWDNGKCKPAKEKEPMTHKPTATAEFLAAALLCGAVLIIAAPATAQDTTTASAGQTTASVSNVSAEPSDEINTGSLDRKLLSQLVIRYTNDERETSGMPPVKHDDALQRLAEKHSRDMANRGYFSHTSQRQDRPDIPFEERVSLQKLGYKSTGENLALQPIVTSRRITTLVSSSGERTREVTPDIATYDELARATVEGWMNSPGHRENILTRDFNLVGIGVGIGERDGVPYAWITQNFGQK
jgi:uncharacterized protein YkwD